MSFKELFEVDEYKKMLRVAKKKIKDVSKEEAIKIIDTNFDEYKDRIKKELGLNEDMKSGAFTAWCKENGLMDEDSTDVPCKCIEGGLKSEDVHVRKMAQFAANMNNC